MKITIKECLGAYKGEGDDLIFDHYAMILSHDTNIYTAHSQLEFAINQVIDAEQLDCPLIPIPKEDLWPPFTPGLTLAPDPPPSDTFIKKRSLIGFDSEMAFTPREVLLHEAQICEILRNHTHRNLASYLGCVCEDGLITGLCFVRYKETLSARLADRNRPLDVHSCLKSVKNGLDHLHALGLSHNDINPTNIMLDNEDMPIIIDFDSCQREGELSFGVGTLGWTNGVGNGMSRRENDEFGLKQLHDTFLKGASSVSRGVNKEESLGV